MIRVKLASWFVMQKADWTKIVAELQKAETDICVRNQISKVGGETATWGTEYDPAELDILTGYFYEGLKQFLAKGDRAEMIKSAAEHCQTMDWPRQREIAAQHLRNRRKLAEWDL